MKFFRLMQEHHDDLGRLIVSPFMTVVSLRYLIGKIDARKWKGIVRGKGIVDSFSVSFQVLIYVIREKMHTAHPS